MMRAAMQKVEKLIAMYPTPADYERVVELRRQAYEALSATYTAELTLSRMKVEEAFSARLSAMGATVADIAGE